MQLRTRMLKAQCGDCAYTVRVARKWIAEYGPPLCPCNGEPMESDFTADLEAGARESMAQLEVGAATLRDRWVEIRKPRDCDGCSSACPRGEKMRHRTYTAGGEFFNTYHCIACDGRTAGSRVALGYA